MLPKPNTFNNNNYDMMWCRHAKFLYNGVAVNRGPGDQECRCVGKLCPALILLEDDNNEWIGICGVDHNITITDWLDIL